MDTYTEVPLPVPLPPYNATNPWNGLVSYRGHPLLVTQYRIYNLTDVSGSGLEVADG